MGHRARFVVDCYVREMVRCVACISPWIPSTRTSRCWDNGTSTTSTARWKRGSPFHAALWRLCPLSRILKRTVTSNTLSVMHKHFWLYTTEDRYLMTTFRCPSDHVLLTVYSSMDHVTWKSPGPMYGWVGRILHPDSCTSVSFWSKVPLLSVWSVAVPLCRPLLPCPSRWHGSLSRHGLWWLTCELHCSPLPWRLGSVYQLWKSPLLFCAVWSSDQTSCLSPQCMSWSSSCKAHDRSILSSPHPWPRPSTMRTPSSCVE